MERLDKFLCDSGVGTRSQVKAILKAGRVLRLGMIDGDKPYVVPLHYGYTLEDGKLTPKAGDGSSLLF